MVNEADVFALFARFCGDSMAVFRFNALRLVPGTQPRSKPLAVAGSVPDHA
jgi:hypothetical protein